MKPAIRINLFFLFGFAWLLPVLLSVASCAGEETVDRTVELGSNDPIICTPERRQCSLDDVVKCNAAGTEWVFFKSCGDEEICLDGDCQPADGDADNDGEESEEE